MTLDAAALERSADPGAFVVLACERAKEWLAQALDHGDIEQIVELKSQAEAIRVYTAQKQLGKDAELSAAEIVRRAERGLGVAVRRGQDAGRISTPSSSAQDRERRRRAGSNDATPCLPRARDFFAHPAEESEARALAATPDDQFDKAIEEAKAEGNLSRANVVRKAAQKRIIHAPDKGRATAEQRAEQLRALTAKGLSPHQIAEELGITESRVRDLARSAGIELMRLTDKRRRIDVNRVVGSTVDGASALASGADLIDYSAVDVALIPGWVSSLEESIRFLTTLKKNLNKELTR